MPTSRVHRILAQSFYSPGYARNTAKEISVGKTFGGTYARIIQRAYRRYRKKSQPLPLVHLLTKCTWNAIRYYDNREELRDFVSLFPQLDGKRRLYRILLGISAVTLLLNVLFEKGYIMDFWPPWSNWTDVLKLAQNPRNFQFATEEEWHERINNHKIYRNITEEVKWRLRLNLVRYSEYDKFYAVHGMSTEPGETYIPLLWPSNRKIFRRISLQSEMAYNKWASLDRERRGTDGRGYPKNRNWHIMEKFMKATEKSYNTFSPITFDLASLKKSRQA